MLITIPTIDLPNWQFGGAAAELRIYALQSFKSGNTHIVAGNYPDQNWYKTYTCTISGNILTVPQLQLDSTTDSDNPNAQYVCVLLDYRKNVREFYLSGNFKVPISYGNTITFAQLKAYQRVKIGRLNETYYNAEQVNALIGGLMLKLTTDPTFLDLLANSVDLQTALINSATFRAALINDPTFRNELTTNQAFIDDLLVALMESDIVSKAQNFTMTNPSSGNLHIVWDASNSVFPFDHYVVRLRIKDD